MKDYNSMKADEYAERMGHLDDLELEIERVAGDVCAELPAWAQSTGGFTMDDVVYSEARRRVMLAIKERNEP